VRRAGAAAADVAASAKAAARAIAAAKRMTKRGIIDELVVRRQTMSYRDSEILVSAVFELMTQGLAD
jgi:hypothetical protein